MMTYSRKWMTVLLGVQALCMMTAGPGQAQDQAPRFLIVTMAGLAPLNITRTPALMRRISPAINGAPLPQALAAISAQSGVDFMFKVPDLPAGKRIVLQATSITVAAALTEMLLGTDIDVVYSRDGRILLTKRSGAALVDPQQVGMVIGRVTERGTNAPVPTAQVTVTGVPSRYTDDKGQFRIPNVPAGEHVLTVKRVGFAVVSRKISIGDGETVTADFVMERVATVLSEVVTTATGERSRLEVGNAIGTIKADSVVATSLIRNMSDLLQARVTGVMVTNGSGRVGTPSKIRIRGITSMTLNNDPIIIMDGIRLNWLATSSGSQTNTGIGDLRNYPAPSRLDDIDPTTIESIDVLRGPSASTLYGTDATNGVIVIKTKKAAVGSWQGSLLADDGWSTYPGTFPAVWYGWGQTSTGTYTNRCQLLTADFGTVCQLDSIVAYDAENDPRLSGYGTGTARSLSANLSGGTAQLQQFLSLRTADAVGLPKMSEVEQRRVVQMWGSTLPDWLVRPNAERDFNGSSRTNLRVGQALDLQATVNGVYRSLRMGTGDDQLFGTLAPPTYQGPWDTLAILPAESMRQKTTSAYKRGFVGTTANYVPMSWLTLTATAGGDYTLRSDEVTRQPSNCTVILAPTTGCLSNHTNDRGETFVTTMNMGAQLSFNPRSWLGLRTSIGEQYSGTTFYELSAGNNGSTNLAFGTDLLTPSPIATSGTPQLYTVTETRDQSATAGFYVEQTVALHERLFFTAALRKDAASAFGPSTNKQLPTYPKVSVSWLVSDEPFFPHSSFISSLRLRAAYGHSGNQARQTDVLPNYQIATVALDNANVPGIVLNQIPNPILKPERVTEAEGGFDLSLLANERIHIEGTLYRKLSQDAIVSMTLPGSYGWINSSQRINVGSVANRGVELSVNAKVLETRTLSWDVGVNWTENANKLTSINNYVFNRFNSYVVGYPLFSTFFFRPSSWFDANGDGILQRNEVAYGTGTPGVFPAVLPGRYYLGPNYPRSEATFRSGLALFSGMLRIDGTVDRVNDAVIFTQSVRGDHCIIAASDCSIDQQALLRATNNSSLASWMRLSELSTTYTLPSSLVRRTVRARSAAITFAGRNLGLWTNYRFKDPTGSPFSLSESQQFGDNGAGFGQPVNWTVRLNMGF